MRVRDHNLRQVLCSPTDPRELGEYSACGVRKFGPALRTGDFAGETGFGSGLAMISDALEAFRGQGR